MIVFYYMFYRISKFFVKYDLETFNPEINSGGIISLMQSFNIIAILYFVFSVKMTLSLSILIPAVPLTLNWFVLLTGKKLKELEIKWDGEDHKTKRRRGFLIVLYMLCSVFFLISAYSKMT